MLVLFANLVGIEESLEAVVLGDALLIVVGRRKVEELLAFALEPS